MARLSVVSGFLGAGKTTLLRQLVARSLARSERSVVIENEFGAVGLDASVLSQAGVPVFELNQGCVCCTLKNDFAGTLERILVDLQPDRIFFEPSGIFIPESLLAIVRAPHLATRCRLAPFVTVVDASAWTTQRKRYGSFFERQVAFADVVALTRSACLDEARLEVMCAELRKANARAGLCVVDRSDTAPALLDALLERGAGFADAVVQPASAVYATRSTRQGDFSYRRTASGTHGFSALSVPLPPSMGGADITCLIDALQSGRYGRVVRAKGWLGDEGRHGSFSLAGGLLEFGTQPAPQHPGTRSEPMIVIIGEHLDRHAIQRLLGAGQTAEETAG